MSRLSTLIVPTCAVFALCASAVVRTQQTPSSASTAPPMPQVLQKYSTVTVDRLKRPADGDWLMVRRTYDGWGFSPLWQITPDNAPRLEPVWSFSTGAINGHEATPLVNNGVMFVATPGNQVIAIDARTGSLLWRYKNTPGPEVVNLHPTSRGVALYE